MYVPVLLPVSHKHHEETVFSVKQTDAYQSCLQEHQEQYTTGSAFVHTVYNTV